MERDVWCLELCKSATRSLDSPWGQQFQTHDVGLKVSDWVLGVQLLDDVGLNQSLIRGIRVELLQKTTLLYTFPKLLEDVAWIEGLGCNIKLGDCWRLLVDINGVVLEKWDLVDAIAAMRGACLGVFLLLENKPLYRPIPLRLIIDGL